MLFVIYRKSYRLETEVR